MSIFRARASRSAIRSASLRASARRREPMTKTVKAVRARARAMTFDQLVAHYDADPVRFIEEIFEMHGCTHPFQFRTDPADKYCTDCRLFKLKVTRNNHK